MFGITITKNGRRAKLYQAVLSKISAVIALIEVQGAPAGEMIKSQVEVLAGVHELWNMDGGRDCNDILDDAEKNAKKFLTSSSVVVHLDNFYESVAQSGLYKKLKLNTKEQVKAYVQKLLETEFA